MIFKCFAIDEFGCRRISGQNPAPMLQLMSRANVGWLLGDLFSFDHGHFDLIHPFAKICFDPLDKLSVAGGCFNLKIGQQASFE